jgi:hypothetical protein
MKKKKKVTRKTNNDKNSFVDHSTDRKRSKNIQKILIHGRVVLIFNLE